MRLLLWAAALLGGLALLRGAPAERPPVAHAPMGVANGCFVESVVLLDRWAGQGGESWRRLSAGGEAESWRRLSAGGEAESWRRRFSGEADRSRLLLWFLLFFLSFLAFFSAAAAVAAAAGQKLDAQCFCFKIK